MIEHAAGEFALAHDDPICTQPLEMLDFLVGMDTRYDVQARISVASLLYDLPRLEPVRNEKRIELSAPPRAAPASKATACACSALAPYIIEEGCFASASPTDEKSMSWF